MAITFTNIVFQEKDQPGVIADSFYTLSVAKEGNLLKLSAAVAIPDGTDYDRTIIHAIYSQHELRLDSFVPFAGGVVLVDGYAPLKATSRSSTAIVRLIGHGPCWLLRRRADGSELILGLEYVMPDYLAAWRQRTTPAPSICQDCKGSGVYVGLVEVEPCRACGGKGSV